MKGRWTPILALAVAACATAQPPAPPPPPPAPPPPPPVSGGVVAEQGPCRFDLRALAFAGSPVEQARCLLQPVRRWGELGGTRASLPQPLARIVGADVSISRGKLRSYLAARGVAETDVGGSIDGAVSQTEAGAAAMYFVIHDTSTPNLRGDEFPPNIDEAGWRYNALAMWRELETPIAHVFVSRDGASITTLDFSVAHRATKLESQIAGAASRGRFLHVENVQPRRSLSPGPIHNDAVAPEPGFSAAQYRRLALVYIAASVRAGRWLIPAFHAALDSGIPDAHDDPQNFDLDEWARALAVEIEAVEAHPGS